MSTPETMLADIKAMRHDCSLVMEELQRLVQELRRFAAHRTQVSSFHSGVTSDANDTSLTGQHHTQGIELANT
jgi:hypothetical protein